MSQHMHSMPTGRVRRTAKIGGLVGGEVARTYATKAVNLVRSDEDRTAANGRRRLEAADRIVEVLGQMKGPAMKIGQMASVLDLGGLPPEEVERLQSKLGELRDHAPHTSFKQMRKVIEDELGDSVEDVFAEFDPNAVAAASIGQVYRARLHDGRDVAVKVQYPRVAAAVNADLQSLGLILRAAKRLAPGIDPASTAVELRERIGEELDYEHEAQAQRAFARRWRGHPFVFIPDVVTSLCRTRVLVTEWIDGIGFEQIKAAPQGTRDRVGETVLRFFLGSLYRFGQFSGDPHPGNFRLMADGRVAFLDFGMTKTVARSRIEAELGVIRAALEHDGDAVRAGLATLGFFALDDRRFDPAQVLEHVRAINAWYVDDEPVTLTTQYVSSLLAHAGDPRSKYWDLMRNETVPAESLLSSRMQVMTLAAIGQLRARANWHSVMAEWLYGSPPATPLGAAEAEFFTVDGTNTSRCGRGHRWRSSSPSTATWR
ncbi:MAG TPA: AarF/ABC1/UbiB kinase family protein [Solirubrobacteraceae bacterium]|nr:AarF/ABC1/UbiB kinase family protein [Solirubrobacteraceae bacterium]